MLDSNLFMDMLKNKEQVLVQLLKDIEQIGVLGSGLPKLVSATTGQVSPEGNVKATNTLAKVVLEQTEIMNRILLLLLVYTASDNYNGDVARMLMKMGKGQEALQEMFKAKMAGR